MRFLDRKQEQAVDDWVAASGGDAVLVDAAMRAVAAERGAVDRNSVLEEIRRRRRNG
ncbi:MAG: hypothetical protein RID91_22820 [Azospirillaceae bacterium]